MSEKRVIRYEVRWWDESKRMGAEIRHSRREDAWQTCWEARGAGRPARVVRIVARKRESVADAYERGRREERADVVAYLRARSLVFGDYIDAGQHIGAAKKGGA